jgi:voltage-gated potassium channel
MFRAFRAMLREPESKGVALAALTVILVGTVAYSVLEDWRPLDALYFCVITLATIGFGDLTPKTDAGKLFTIIYVMSGIGIIAAFVTELVKYREPGARRAGRPETRSAAPGPVAVVDARSKRDPDSPRTDIGPGG